MSTGWAKLHNSLWSDRKWMRASLAARGLWTSAVSYSNAMRTYGRIDGHLLALFQGTPELAAELVEVGLWDVDGDGWQVHDWEQHQTSRQHAEEVSAKRAAAGRKGGKAPRANRTESPRNSNDKQFAKHSEANASTPKQEEEGEGEEEPTTPLPPEGELLATPEPSTRKRAAFVYPDAFERFWSVWPKPGDTKRTAHTAWEKATRGSSRRPARITVEALQTAVEAYAADPHLPEPQYIPAASTWLNQDRWENGPLPPRGGSRNRPEAGDTHRAMHQSHDAAEVYRALESSGFYDPQPAHDLTARPPMQLTRRTA